MSNLRCFCTCALVALAVAGCAREEVRTYRVAKEKDPEMPLAQTATSSSGESTNAAPGASPTDMANTAVPITEGSGLTWDVPAGWILAPAAPMRKATFKIAGPSGPAELSVTAFPRNVGGELANLNRWRGQLHLASLDEAMMEKQIARRSGHDLSFAVVDFSEQPGAAAGNRLLGAIVPYSGSTWFFKLTGPAPTIEAERGNFEKFLDSVRPTAATP